MKLLIKHSEHRERHTVKQLTSLLYTCLHLRYAHAQNKSTKRVWLSQVIINVVHVFNYNKSKFHYLAKLLLHVIKMYL